MLRFIGRVAAWFVILGCLAAIAAAVVVPRLAGATPYTVLTGSMRPGLPPGTLVVAKPVDPADIGVGDVVTVQLRSGEPVYVTHRVVEVQQRLDGKTQFVTKGDDNDVADSELRLPEQIRGRLWYAVPYLGRLNTAISGSQRQLGVYAVGGALVLYALVMFTGAARDRRRENDEDQQHTTHENEKEVVG